MDFLKELQFFGRNILLWLYLFLASFLFFFAFGIREIELLGRKFLFLAPGFESFATAFFKKIQADLLTQEIEVMVINPLDALWTQIGISLFLAFILTLPFLLFRIIRYAAPAFSSKEKRAVLRAIVPAMVLFFSGCIFSYFFLIPVTFEILYAYVIAVGVKPFFAINEFVFLVLVLTLSVGIIFMLPIFMMALSYLGIMEPQGWKNNWKYAFLFFLIFSAIITPDGSGITMLLLSVPLTLLYFLGYIGSKKFFLKKSILKK